ncbi:30S ribosomal protein S7 [bacterium]|nr:30S ribosomal protein S7 [bacterium]
MPRRGHISRKELLSDPVYNSKLITRFVNNLMTGGKKNTASRIFYSAIERVSKKQNGENPLEVFKKAIDAAKPIVEVKSRRIGGANYQVPIEVKPERGVALAIRWIITYARARKEKTMADRLSGEISDILKNEGATMKKRDETHRMAEANKAFAHYRL